MFLLEAFVYNNLKNGRILKIQKNHVHLPRNKYNKN
jgi:hypothetical protein